MKKRMFYFFAALTSLQNATAQQNIGIGTTTPLVKLHIVDSTNSLAVHLESINANNNVALRLISGTSALSIEKRGSGNANINNIQSTSGDLLLGTVIGNSLLFATNNLERMRIDNNGTVGIGTSAPNSNSILDLSNSQGKGLLIPQLTDVQMNALATAPDGMLIYNITQGGLYMRKLAQWFRSDFSLPYKVTLNLPDTLLNIANSGDGVVAAFQNSNPNSSSNKPVLSVSSNKPNNPLGVINAFDVHSTMSGGSETVIRGDSHLGIALYGTSDSAYGVAGATTAGVGVYGLTFGGASTYGVLGSGSNAGSVAVYANNVSGIGLMTKTDGVSGYPFQAIGRDTAKMMLASTSAFGPGMIEFISDKGLASQWRPGFIISGDSANTVNNGGQYTGRLDFYTNGTTAANKFGTQHGMSVLDGKIGIGTIVPVAKLDLNDTLSGSQNSLRIYSAKDQPINITHTGSSGLVSLQLLRLGGNAAALGISTLGTGSAATFAIANNLNANPAVDISTNGTGEGIKSFNTGSGVAGNFYAANNTALQVNSNGPYSADISYNNTTGCALNITSATGNPSLGAVNINVSGSTSNRGLQISNAGVNSGILINNSNLLNAADEIHATNLGTGRTAYFTIGNALNSTNALYVSSAGTGNTAFFQNTNTTNSNPVIDAYNSGNGDGGYFEISPASGSGTSVRAKNFGTGRAGNFEIANAANGNYALYSTTNGLGVAGYFTNTSSTTGSAGYFNNTSSSNTSAVLTVVNNGSGNSASFTDGSGVLINQAGSTSAFQLTLNQTNTGYARLHFKNTIGDAWTIAGSRTATAATDQLNFYNEQSGADRLIIYGNGNATLSGTLTQSSDVRLKKNIRPLNDVLPALLSLNGYTYNWKEESRGTEDQIGLLAQEVEKVYPELVRTGENGNKSVAYQNMVPVLLQAIKEQQKEIEELRKEIREIKK